MKPIREVTRPVRQDGFTGYIDQAAVPRAKNALLPGLDVAELSADRSTGRLAAQVEFARGWKLAAGRVAQQSLQVFVLQGALRAGTDELIRYSLLYVPAGTAWPALEAVASGTALLFLDPPVAGFVPGGDIVVVHGSRLEWKEGTLGKKLGIELPLDVMLLWKDATTGSRTWLARLRPGGKFPWEKHSVVQEGYLLEGDDRVAECIGPEILLGRYRPGGYFHRPPGIVHMGPLGGTVNGATWFLRAPADIDLILVNDP